MEKESLILAGNIAIVVLTILPLVTPSWKWVLACVPLYFIFFDAMVTYKWGDALLEMNEPGYRGTPGDALGMAGIVISNLVMNLLFLVSVGIRLAMQPWWAKRKTRRENSKKAIEPTTLNHDEN